MKTLVIIFLSIIYLNTFQFIQAQPNHTAKEGLQFAFEKAREMLGDSTKFYGAEYSPYKNYGIRDYFWSYNFCNNDTCISLKIKKDSGQYYIIDTMDVNLYSYDSEPIDTFQIDSDTLIYLSENCVQGYYKLCITELRLEDFKGFSYFEKIHWFVVLVECQDTNSTIGGHLPGDVHLYIDALTGDCKYFYTNVRDKNDKYEIQISPNPASENCTITLDENFNFENVRFILFNSIGEQIAEFDKPSSNKININTADLPQGVYFLKLLTKKETIAKPFVIVR